MEKKVWQPLQDNLYLVSKQIEYPETLENKVYELQYDDNRGFSVKPVSDSFHFHYKIYSLETGIIKRALKYYNNTKSGNLGILLNGLRGTGKTITSKILCNELNLPVVIISNGFSGAEDYLNSIGQDIIIFIDEYEKVYERSNDFLTIMDGALNSDFRRVFILTTNNLYINENLIDRPSRIRYLKTFNNLTPEIVEEIVDDILEHTEFKADCISYISTLKIITVDIVKAIINEVNIQEESPVNFKEIFNASVKKGKYKLHSIVSGEMNLLDSGVKLGRIPNYNDSSIGYSFVIDNDYLGDIVEVLNHSTVKVKVKHVNDDSDENDSNEISGDLLTCGKRNKHEKLPYNLKSGELVTIMVSEDLYYNDSYTYGNTDSFDHDQESW